MNRADLTRGQQGHVGGRPAPRAPQGRTAREGATGGRVGRLSGRSRPLRGTAPASCAPRQRAKGAPP